MYSHRPLPPLDLAPAPMTNLMTVDVEDYFHVNAFAGMVPRESWPTIPGRVESSTARLLDLFAEHGVRGTFFVLGWVAQQYPQLVQRIADAGHELASHSHWHRLVYSLSPEEFREDLRRARGAIGDATGVTVRGFRAPSFSIVERSLWALDVLAEEGYHYDASIFPVRHDVYGIPHAPRQIHIISRQSGTIVELPGSTGRIGGDLRVPIGGGYFRFLPYAATRRAIARFNAEERQPAIFYLHPWEVDPEQPRLRGSLRSGLRHYNNLARTEPRLRRLLADFRWGPIADALPLPDPPAAPIPPSAPTGALCMHTEHNDDGHYPR
jgi:polysaccharide deacetylase family protein (PEP-CTERM system associated)